MMDVYLTDAKPIAGNARQRAQLTGITQTEATSSVCGTSADCRRPQCLLIEKTMKNIFFHPLLLNIPIQFSHSFLNIFPPNIFIHRKKQALNEDGWT